MSVALFTFCPSAIIAYTHVLINEHVPLPSNGSSSLTLQEVYIFFAVKKYTGRYRAAMGTHITGCIHYIYISRESFDLMACRRICKDFFFFIHEHVLVL